MIYEITNASDESLISEIDYPDGTLRIESLMELVKLGDIFDVQLFGSPTLANNHILKYNGTNWTQSNDISLGNITSSNTLLLGTGAGLSLTPAATHSEFVLGNILSFESNANGGLELSDCDDTSGYLNIPFGVALETSAANSTTAIKVHTVHGGKVNVKISSSTTNQGQWIYLSSTAGIGTTTVPASGLVWRLGLSTERNTSAVTDADIIWMPQFIADLG
jgi:hypothetical protein